MLILLLAPFVNVRLTPLEIAQLLPAMFLTAFALCSLGLVVAARMRSMEGFQLIMNFFLMPMFFLSGALFPLSNLPAWLTVLTRINPVSYGVDAIRRIVLGHSGVPAEVLGQVGLELFGHPLNPVLDLAVVGTCAACLIALAVRAFSIQD